MTYYFAYGSNLNIAQMSRRCPNAKPIILPQPLYISDWQLCFRGVADIEPQEGSKLPIGLWKITPECEKRLDSYEGYPHLYSKIYFTMLINQKKETILCYQMNTNRISPPFTSYYNTIFQGYKDFNLNTEYLEKARNQSYPQKYEISKLF